jgi:cell division protein FtsL
MEKVFMVLAAILLIALLVLAIRVIFKTTKELWKRLVDRLRRYAADSGEDYIDEAESTLNWDERTQSVLDRLQKAVAKPRQPKWEELDGRGRIRRLYQQFLRRKPEEKNKTAREALKSDKHLSSAQIGSFTQLYEKARYSDHDISTQEADQLKSNIRL